MTEGQMLVWTTTFATMFQNLASLERPKHVDKDSWVGSYYLRQ